MRHPRVTITTAAVVAAGAVGGIALAVGGSSNSSGYGAPAGTSSNGSLTRPMSAANSATIHTATDVVQGKSEQILVDSKGLPLYTYKGDTPTRTAVNGQLASLWPPLVSAAPTERGTHGVLTTVTTTNGTQVAYNGHFLYTFVDDKPGHVSGQGVENFAVATPSVAMSAPTQTTVAPSTGNAYGW